MKDNKKIISNAEVDLADVLEKSKEKPSEITLRNPDVIAKRFNNLRDRWSAMNFEVADMQKKNFNSSMIKVMEKEIEKMNVELKTLRWVIITPII